MLLGMLAALGQGHMYYMRSRSSHIWGFCMPILVFAAVIRNKTTKDIEVILMSFSMARQIVLCQNLDCEPKDLIEYIPDDNKRI